MIAKLSSELQQAVHEQTGPISVVDLATNRLYVLISREQYERLRPVFEAEPLTTLEQERLLSDAGRRAGWNDPEMDAYDNYDEQRSKQP
jgi:hypothetical protein